MNQKQPYREKKLFKQIKNKNASCIKPSTKPYN